MLNLFRWKSENNSPIYFNDAQYGLNYDHRGRRCRHHQAYCVFLI